MSEHSEHKSDTASEMGFLESSALTARLHRRLSSSPGVIDIQDILKTYARLTKWAAHARLLIDDLLAKYGIDDGSVPGSLPLVTEQPWMLNLNTYLTNQNTYQTSRNSFSSTANNFYSATTSEFSSRTPSSSPASQLVTSDSTSFRALTSPAPRQISRHEPGHEVKTAQLDSESSSRASGKFRVSRKPRRVSSEFAAAVVRDVQENPLAQPLPALPYHAGSSPQPAKEEEEATARTREIITSPSKITGSTIASAADRPLASGGDLPLVARPPAQLPAQRERISEARNTSPLVSKDQPASDRPRSKDWSSSVSLAALESTRPEKQPRTVALQSGLPPLSRSSEMTRLTLNRNVQVARPADGSRLAMLETQVVSEDSQKRQADFFLSRNAGPKVEALNRALGSGAAYRGGTGVPPVNHAQDARATPTRFLAGPRQPDLVWRRNGIDRTVRELMSAISDRTSLQAAQRAPAGVSTTQSPQSIQSFERESVNRRNQSEDGVEITAERILRRISRTLLVERDRRGY